MSSTDTKIVVLKFGSSVLRSESDLKTVVDEIDRRLSQGDRVVAVVSAFGDNTDTLNDKARELCGESVQPDESMLAHLLATGEAQASTLLGLALKRASIDTSVLSPVQAGLRTSGPLLDSTLIKVDVDRLRRELSTNVVVLPGFVGVTDDGGTSLLGRGGSDLTALFIAQKLQGECVLVKDVDGLYTSDPNSSSQAAYRFTRVSYETAVSVGGAVVQAKGIRFAQEHGQQFRVTCIGSDRFTEVGEFRDQLEDADARVQPLRSQPVFSQIVTLNTARLKTSTRCVQSGTGDDQYGAIVPPIYQTATFKQPTATEFGEFDYSRSGNPTRLLLEQQLADLEEGRRACAFASGMAAITALIRAVVTGGEIIAGDDLYGGTVRLLERVKAQQNIRIHYVNTGDLDAVQKLINRQTQLILIETPSNPLFHITDIRELARLAVKVGAILAVDNSMLSPVFQKPLLLGANVVIHSATKFLSGHSDVTAGALITKDESLHQQLAFQQNAEGSALSPFDSWLLLRGLKTLALRVEQQNRTARAVSEFLVSHPAVSQVFYPGLTSHTGHRVHREQASGDGAVVSFITGDPEFSTRLVEATKLFKIAVSFGSVGSTISLPCRMSHASIPTALKSRLGPPSDLVRLSVGIEDVGDLIEDLAQAFSASAEESVLELAEVAS